MEQQKLPLIAGGNAKWDNHFEGQFGNLLYETKHTLTIQTSYPAPWYLHKGVEDTKPHAWIFIAALLIIAKTWKNPRCPLVGEYINKWWYFQTMECYSVLERYEITSRKKAWRKLQYILISKKSQFEKATA